MNKASHTQKKVIISDQISNSMSRIHQDIKDLPHKDMKDNDQLYGGAVITKTGGALKDYTRYYGLYMTLFSVPLEETIDVSINDHLCLLQAVGFHPVGVTNLSKRVPTKNITNKLTHILTTYCLKHYTRK